MNLVDKLMAVEPSKIEEKAETTIESQKLRRLLGSEDPVEVRLREGDPATVMDLSMMAKGKNKTGDDVMKVLALIACECVVEPDLKSKELQKHFNCTTPKELAIKLFGMELDNIANKAIELTGVGNTEEEVKN